METASAVTPSVHVIQASPGAKRFGPLKVLVPLTVAVLLVHIALLQASPLTLGLSQPEPARAFITRSIELPPVVPAPVAQPAAPIKRKAPPLAKKPAPAEVRAPSNGETLAPAAPVAAADPDPAPVVTAQNEAPAATEPPASPPPEKAALASAHTVPGSVRLKYQVSANKFPFSLNAELRWQQNGEDYDARLEFSAFGQARVQTSRGQLTPQGLAPVRFSDKYRSEVAAHFNREQGKVTFSANTPDVPLLAGAQDQLSILVQLAALMASDPSHYPPATTLSFQAIGPRDAETWTFTVGSSETLILPGGELAALKLVRTPRQEFGQKLEVWLAPALGYLPARVLITESNGDYLDQKWLATESLK